MMNWWKKYSALKHGRQMVKGTRKVLRMHRDVLDPRQVTATTDVTDELQGALKSRNADAVNNLVDKLDPATRTCFPAAIICRVARECRSVPGGGDCRDGGANVLYPAFQNPDGLDAADAVRYLSAGTSSGQWPVPDEYKPLPYVNGPPSLIDKVIGTIWSGMMYEPSGLPSRGDHIFVDRFTYHFRKPHRGEVIVFDTSEIVDIPESSRGKFYIKRLIGLGGDRVQIKPPYVLVNGSPLDERPPFQRIYSRENGYNGYVLPRGFPPPKYIRTEDDVYTVPVGNLFVLGDNSVSSLDGRFWGSLQEKALVGRSVFVYWPFSKRFGLVE